MDLLHRKLILSESVLGSGAYADSYLATAKDRDSQRPIVIYIGGSISDTTYETRRKTKPHAIVREFIAAAGEQPGADLLVCPFPPPSRVPVTDVSEPPKELAGIPLLSENEWQSILRRRFLAHLVTELLRERNAPLPSAVSFLGFSSGAYLAFGLAIDLPRARGAAVFGGTGMAEAIAQSPPDSYPEKRFLMLAGDEDPLAPNAGNCYGLLCRRGDRVDTRTVPAGHSFREYAACGAVRDCFAFALALLLEHG